MKIPVCVALAAMIQLIPFCAKAATNGLAVAMVGEQDPALLDRVRGYMVREFKCPIRTVTVRETGGLSETDGFGRLMATGDVAMVVLVNIPDRSAKLQSAVIRSKGFGVVSLPSLAPTNVASGNSTSEVFYKRVEKESVRTICQLIGMDKCPIIRCALFPAKTSRELDGKSRSLCPPCRMKAWELLRQRDVHLTVEPPPGSIRPKAQEGNSTKPTVK